MPENASVYDQAVHITEDYLGPAGERFIRRQIVTHIGIEPEMLGKDDLSKLLDWVGLSFAVLTNNRRDVEDFARSLKALTIDQK